jgi:hypothetical protein
VRHALLARNAALRTTPIWLIVMLVGAQVVAGYYGAHVSQTGAVTSTPLLVGGWILLALYLAWGQVRHRCGSFDLTLPVPARELWYASLVGSSLAATLMLAVILAVVAAILGLVGSRGSLDPLRAGEVLRVGSILLAGALCGVAWRHARHLELASAPGGVRQSLAVLAGLLALLAPMLLLQHRPLLLVTVLLAIAVLTARHAGRRLPAAYALSPLAPDGRSRAGDAPAPASRARPARGLRQAWLVYLMVVRSAPKGPGIMAVSTPFLLLMGALLSGLLTRLFPDSDLRFAWLPMTAYLAVAFTAPVMANLRAVDALPLGRRRLLLLLTLPPLLITTAGYLGGVVWMGLRDFEMPRIVFVDEAENYGLRVPTYMWRMAWDGEAPAATAPWGETHPAMTIPVIEGATPVIYKPYTTPVDASRDYVAWQISRAAAAMYGSRLTHEEIAERYLWTDFAGRVRLQDETLELPGEGWVVVERSTGPFLPVTMALVAALMYAGIVLYAPGVRAGVTRRRRVARMWAVLGVLLALHMTPHVLALSRLARPWVLEAAGVDMMLKIVRAVPGGAAGVWIAALLVGAAAFEAAAIAFRRMESPVAPDTCLWNNLGKGDLQ